MYDETVPVFIRGLTALSGIIGRAEAHCAANKIEPAALIGFRLYPDMWSFSRQVQAATDHPRRAMARLAGVDPTPMADSEPTFASLGARVTVTLDAVRAADRAVLDAAADRTIRFPVGPKEMVMKGTEYVRTFILPNYYFHLTAAYISLRHNGVALGKADFLGEI